MRIGLDFDNTIGDFLSLLMDVTVERTGFDLRAAWATGGDGQALAHAAIGSDRLDALIAEIDQHHMVRMLPVPGAIEVTRRLASRHELVIVTARSAAESVSARDWLDRHEIPVADLVPTNYASKAPHASNLGLAMHLDDNATVLADFDEAHPTIPVLLAHPLNARSPRAAHWRSVEDWLAFERLVQSLEQER